jgi:Tol biopolymer transport system component
VETLTGGRGWISPRFLTFATNRVADVPLITSFAPAVEAPAAASAPAPSVPLRPALNLLVFQRASGEDIMLINTDGSGLRRLTNGLDPVLSPDGKSVAFTRWQGEQGSLWTINVDGSNEHQVIDGVKQAKGPDWSPDGTRIVLNYQNGGRLEDKDICYNLTKGDPSPPWNARNFRVKMEGRIPFLCWTLPPDPFWGLRVVNLSDGHSEDVDGGTYAFRPAWDPGQTWRIISDGGRGLLGIDVNRADYRQNVTDNVNDSSPVFSPDGRYLALTSGNSGGGFDIYRLNADGSGRVRLTKTPLWVGVSLDEQKPWNNVAPAWSPDGAQIAFLTDRAGRWEIWAMGADGANPHPLFAQEINDQLNIQYNFVDERVFSWR